MRKKYLNMSGADMEQLTPADILNITYEHNQKRMAIMEHSQRHLSKEIRNYSSSSSSLQNEAGFNIFEEIYFDQQNFGAKKKGHQISSKHIFENSKGDSSDFSEGRFGKYNAGPIKGKIITE